MMIPSEGVQHFTRQHTAMKTWITILFGLGTLAACIVSAATKGEASAVVPILIFGSALWAAFDSSKVQLSRYKSGISYGPVSLFFGCLLLWIVAFPWYLVVRSKIRTGTAVLKDTAVAAK
jgi:hypothetical protein